jgi:hypothetical protein
MGKATISAIDVTGTDYFDYLSYGCGIYSGFAFKRIQAYFTNNLRLH